MTTKPNDDENKEETLNRFWLVEDMYLFENMGFSKTVDNIKYLACAECDVGPIGWHDLISKKNYLSIDRTLSLGNS